MVCLLLSRSIGLRDCFADEISALASYIIVVIFHLVLWIPLWGIICLQKSTWQQQSQDHPSQSYSPLQLGSLLFPIYTTAYLQVMARWSPIGSIGSSAMDLAFAPSLSRSVAVWGEMGLSFWVSWMTSITVAQICGLLPRKHLSIFMRVSCLALVFGGYYTMDTKGMLLEDITTWPLSTAPVLQTTCITGPRKSDPISEQRLVSLTNQRLAAGDDLIVWSEEASNFRLDVSAIQWNPDNPGAVVAVAFMEPATISKSHNNNSSTSMFWNSIELWQNGISLNRYDKNRPVPIVEGNILPGKELPIPVEITFTPLLLHDKSTTIHRQNTTLKVATAICFDLDYPDLLWHAHTADLVFGPSEYWGAIGTFTWGHNQFRALENGFTLFKCSAMGTSGGVDPYGYILGEKPMTYDAIWTMQLPVQSGIITIYSDYGGWTFGWICCGITLLHLLAQLISRWMVLNRYDRVGHGESTTDAETLPVVSQDTDRFDPTYGDASNNNG